jgi:hypothetical protein
MKFFNIDQHCATIAEIAHVFRNLGHEVDDWTLSGHHWVMNKPKANIKMGEGALTCSGVCTQEVCDAFYNQYKDELSKYDAFICCYPAEFALLYEKWNKPIIVWNCIRYEHPNTWSPHILNRLTDFIAVKRKEGLLHWVYSNKGDQFYTKYFLDIDAPVITLLGEYTGHKYTGTRDKFIIHDRSEISVPGNLCISLGAIRDGNWRYTWQNLYSYKGVIHVPYSNTTSSSLEQYTANVPLFFPSKKHIKELFYQGTALTELTFYKINHKQEPDDLNNPNSLRNPAILDKWIDSCDYYTTSDGGVKYVQYFDSPSHLEHLLRTVNLQEISNNMAKDNILRKEYVYEQWKRVIAGI